MRVDNMEKHRQYFDSSAFPLLEGDTVFTVLYEAQAPPRKVNDALCSFLPGHLQWLGNALAVKHLPRNTPMHSKPQDLPTVIGLIF